MLVVHHDTPRVLPEDDWYAQTSGRLDLVLAVSKKYWLALQTDPTNDSSAFLDPWLALIMESSEFLAVMPGNASDDKVSANFIRLVDGTRT